MTSTAPVSHGPDAIRAAVGFEDVVEPVSAALADFSRGLARPSGWASRTWPLPRSPSTR